MLYTRETRIKHYRKNGKEYYSAQVRYKLPFTNIRWWEDFDEHFYNPFCFVTDLPAKAFSRAWDKDKEATGLTFAKLVIDTYLEMLDNPKDKDGVIEYIKYPEDREMKGLFLDDERIPKDVTWLQHQQAIEWDVVRNYDCFERAILCKQYDIISFDHDIQDFTDQGEERTGYTCFKKMLDLVLDGAYTLPICYVHSQNVAGAKNIKEHYENAKKFLKR